MKEAPKVGTRVAHVQTSELGTVVGRAIAARSAGNALMVRVRWDNPLARAEGSPTFVSQLRAIDNDDTTTDPAERIAAILLETVGRNEDRGNRPAFEVRDDARRVMDRALDVWYRTQPRNDERGTSV